MEKVVIRIQYKNGNDGGSTFYDVEAGKQEVLRLREQDNVASVSYEILPVEEGELPEED